MNNEKRLPLHRHAVHIVSTLNGFEPLSLIKAINK